jgi:hypothetical protein
VSGLALDLPDEFLEEIAARVARILVARSDLPRSAWMTRRDAAEYLRLPLSRLEKDRRIPCHRDEGRVLYHRDELDTYFLGLGR